MVTTGKFVCWVFTNQYNSIVCSNLLDSKEKKLFQLFHPKDGWYLYSTTVLYLLLHKDYSHNSRNLLPLACFSYLGCCFPLLALANERIMVQLYEERIPCAVQDLRPPLSILSAFSFLSASVIRIIRTKTLQTLLLLSVKLTRERQIYNTLARQN